MSSLDLEQELKRIERKYRERAKAIMNDMNSRGLLYSSFTITERVDEITKILENDLLIIAEHFNNKKSQSRILSFIDNIKRQEKDSLTKFCASMKNIVVSNADFAKYDDVKITILNKMRANHRNHLFAIATFVVSVLTLIVSIIAVIQGFSNE